MFSRYISPRLLRQSRRNSSFYLFSSLSAATLPTFLILNSDSLPSPATPHDQPLKALVRSYIVYSLCSIPALVDNSPSLLTTLAKVPGLRELMYGLVRVTFFDQFVGGETASATLPLLRALRAANKGALFSYSVEVDEDEALGSSTTANGSSKGNSPHKRVAQEILNCIDVAADFEDSLQGASKSLPPYHSSIGTATPFGTHSLSQKVSYPPYRISDSGRRTWVAIKLTAMLPDAHALINFSKAITSLRERMKHMEGKSSSRGSERADPCTYDRLRNIFQGSESLSVDAIPFPGCATLDDMELICSSASIRSKHDLSDEASLTTQDIHDLNELYNDLLEICTRAQQRGVKVIFDAEYSWYQPAIDALTYALMRKFNDLSSSADNNHRHPRVQPLVYTTYQAYLRRTPLHLAYTLHDAQRNGYALGVKLVRGAYHPHEITAHASAAQSTVEAKETSLAISPDVLPPVWLTKQDTDKTYNDCVQLVIAAVKDDIDKGVLAATNDNEARSIGDAALIAGSNFLTAWIPGIYGWLKQRSTPFLSETSSGDQSLAQNPTSRPSRVGVGVLFGTHNWDSCNIVLDQIIAVGLGKLIMATDEADNQGKKVALGQDVTDRVAIGQLYGMCDDLTDSVVSRTLSSAPLAIKYVPYGNLKEVLPYLSRRALENKSVLNDGGATRERRRAGKEIWKRVKAFSRVAAS